MRLFSLTLVTGALALGAATLGYSVLAETRSPETTTIEQFARQGNHNNNTVHRGSGRRQILAIATPNFF